MYPFSLSCFPLTVESGPFVKCPEFLKLSSLFYIFIGFHVLKFLMDSTQILIFTNLVTSFFFDDFSVYLNVGIVFSSFPFLFGLFLVFSLFIFILVIHRLVILNSCHNFLLFCFKVVIFSSSGNYIFQFI